jgi:hypothetical protein
MLASIASLALFMHLLGAFLLIGGTMVAGVGFETARRRERPDEIALLLGVTRVGVLLVVVGELIVLAFGLWLVELRHVGYRTGWVVASLAMLGAAAVIGALGGRRPKQARLLATRLAAADQTTTPQLRALLDDRSSRTANYLSSVLVLGIVALMVFQP